LLPVIKIAGKEYFDFTIFFSQFLGQHRPELICFFLLDEASVEVAIKGEGVDGFFNNSAKANYLCD
jgi:hypothetical protein